MSSHNFIDELSKCNSKVMLYEVTPESFYDIEQTLKPVKGTNRLQQLVCLEKGSNYTEMLAVHAYPRLHPRGMTFPVTASPCPFLAHMK